ncbi:tricarboxylate carrier, putative [Eimeria necatrix]|uniref:Tricarboxylate carrier, putative n=1 Tax=Eimeria necatrix TaxID=51315 RepID=U6MUZ5_9EIME|nr:tricarboxylate carrier, putative [Eimeria necatrix]CDJ66913.1 tricarboxylate carrier, putative [Eimeria necatrix]
METELALEKALQEAARPENSYWGRVRSFRDCMNPRFMFASKAEIEKAKEVKALADSGKWRELLQQNISPKELKYQIALTNASVSSSTGDIIPLPLRLSAFAPVNLPICAGLIFSAPTVGNSILWQWVNQTYNAAFNYANGNQSGEANKQQQQQNLLRGYSAAAVVSVGLAVGLNSWVRRLRAPQLVQQLLQGAVPFASVAAANAANLLLMRWQECSQVSTQLSVVYGCLNLGLPLAVGIFPSSCTISISELEKEIQEKAEEDGKPILKAVFNRGV